MDLIQITKIRQKIEFLDDEIQSTIKVLHGKFPSDQSNKRFEKSYKELNKSLTSILKDIELYESYLKLSKQEQGKLF